MSRLTLEIGQDGQGEWAWLVTRAGTGELVISDWGFPSPEAAEADALKRLDALFRLVNERATGGVRLKWHKTG
jgi:hypothetical protein